MKFYRGEISSLIIASLVLTLAFSILFVGLSITALVAMPIVFAIIVPAFIFHELAHKAVAQHYGIHAGFVTYKLGLVLALVSSFFGFIFAAPGAVMMSGFKRPSKRELLHIAAAGPLSNIIMAVLALPFIANPVAYMFFSINAILALFNLIPFGPLDGFKIFHTNKIAWTMMVITAFILYIL
ncbi:MAG: site-2 protease family protein [Methanobacteriota archaeon]|nr:MAG: site-2 protease family protein [Euryarchaeota archaeon]